MLRLADFKKKAIWKENVRLVKSAADWSFEVTGQGEGESTVFIVTGIEDEAFSSENPENEFPQVIVYSKTDQGMKAVISGNDMEIPFLFEKVQ